MAYSPADDEIDLLELFGALWQGRWWIIASGILCGAIAVGVALWLPNIYRSEALLAPSAEQQGGDARRNRVKKLWERSCITSRFRW